VDEKGSKRYDLIHDKIDEVYGVGDLM